MKNLSQKIAVVTGAAGGIGRATALRLASSGCQLALVDLDAPGLDETLHLLHRQSSPVAHHKTFIADVADADAMAQLAADVIDHFGAAHIIINNAGINITASFQQHSLQDFRRLMDVNFHGVVHGCYFFLPHLQSVDQAHIVNISSAFGITGVAGQTAYCASKFALRGLSEALHEELADSHIHVTVVHPGCINTNIPRAASITDEIDSDKIIDFYATKGASPDLVARRILQAIQRQEHRVLVTPETYLIDLLRRLLPVRGNRLANRLMTRALGIEFPRS